MQRTFVRIHEYCIMKVKPRKQLHTVERWHKKLAKGCTSIDDAAQSSRPSKTINEMVHCKHALLEEDHHYTITNHKYGHGKHFMHTTQVVVLFIQLYVICRCQSVCQIDAATAHWDKPKAASDRVSGRGKRLTQMHRTRDELWIHLRTPETKEQSKLPTHCYPRLITLSDLCIFQGPSPPHNQLLDCRNRWHVPMYE